MQDLCPDIIGTNPTTAKLVDHAWLTPDPKTYDNYPSDNNPVRIGPKLADLWNHQPMTGISLIPNQTVQPLAAPCCQASDAKDNVVREAKKAMMMGLTGSDLADHLRARFASSDIVLAKDDLTVLAEECGLLGNIYIDASAFTSSKEAEQFMSQHRTRLAQDIVINESKLTPDAVRVLASKFRKNVLAKVSYDAATLEKYRNHLIAAGRIANDFVIDSKESLRKAFTLQPVTTIVAKATEEKKLSKKDIVEEMSVQQSSKNAFHKDASEDLNFRQILPVLEFTRSQLVKGKDASDLKEMLRSKYASEDLKDSAKYMGIVIAELREGSFTPESVDALLQSGEITEYAGMELKRLAQKYPFNKDAYTIPEVQVQRPVGIMAQLHTLSPTVTRNLDEYRQASATALRKGFDVDAVRAKLLTKLSADEADAVILDAVSAFNSDPAGVVANAPVKASKEVFADAPEVETLPDPSTIVAQTDEILSFFNNDQEMVVDIDAGVKAETINIAGLSEKSGMDTAI